MIPSSSLEEKLAGNPCGSGSVKDAPDAPDAAKALISQIKKGEEKFVSLQNRAFLRGLSVTSGSLIIAAAIIQTNTSKPVEDPWLKALLFSTSLSLGFFSGRINWPKDRDRQ